MEDVERNEHALKLVIKSVDKLVKKYEKMDDEDPMLLTHLDLSAASLLSELHSSAIQHAKQEVLMMTKLDGCLSRFMEILIKVGGSIHVINDLKVFREEVQRLFARCQIPVDLIKPRPNPLTSSVQESSAKNTSNDRESSTKSTANDTLAERTHTVDKERPFNELDLSDLVCEISQETLRKIRERQTKPDTDTNKAVTTSSDTDAVKTESGETNSDEERSQRIWMEEPLEMPPTMNPITPPSTPTPQWEKSIAFPMTKHFVKVNAARMETNGNGVQAIDSVPSSSKTPATSSKTRSSSLPRTKECAPDSNIERKRKDAVNRIIWTVIRDGLLITMPVLLCIGFLMAHEWNRQSKKSFNMIGWQFVCSLANTFCENYDTFCSDYCASGLQLEKWKGH